MAKQPFQSALSDIMILVNDGRFDDAAKILARLKPQLIVGTEQQAENARRLKEDLDLLSKIPGALEKELKLGRKTQSLTKIETMKQLLAGAQAKADAIAAFSSSGA